jgi:S-adenosylmethionine uptake transporter
MIPFAPTSNYHLSTWIALAALGTVSLLGQLAMTRAFSTGPATFLASLQYATVAFAALYGVVIWGDSLTTASVVGLALIVLSGILALQGARRAA